MKKIIDGRVYDTDTALRIGGDSANIGQFDYWCEELYRKRTGEYFLYGEGGPMSDYARQTGVNNWSGGETIKPITYAEAQAWAEKHLDADVVMEYFAISEDDSKTAVTVSIAASIVDRARQAASQRGTTLSTIFEEAIDKYLQ